MFAIFAFFSGAPGKSCVQYTLMREMSISVPTRAMAMRLDRGRNRSRNKSIQSTRTKMRNSSTFDVFKCESGTVGRASSVSWINSTEV